MGAHATRSVPALAGFSAALALGPALHALVRALMEARAPAFDPRAFVWTERSPFLEQLGITAFLVVVLGAFLAPWLARRPALASRVVYASAWTGTIAAALSGLLRR